MIETIISPRGLLEANNLVGVKVDPHSEWRVPWADRLLRCILGISSMEDSSADSNLWIQRYFLCNPKGNKACTPCLERKYLWVLSYQSWIMSLRLQLQLEYSECWDSLPALLLSRRLLSGPAWPWSIQYRSFRRCFYSRHWSRGDKRSVRRRLHHWLRLGYPHDSLASDINL